MSTIPSPPSTTVNPPPPSRDVIFFPHHSRDRKIHLRPWLVHIFQGKPHHQQINKDTQQQSNTNVDISQTNAAPVTAQTLASSLSAPTPSSFVSLDLPPTDSTNGRTSLPFAAPTTKESHDDHDVSLLSPEQSAFYANEYGKVEQQLELASVLDSMRYRDETGDIEKRICEKVVFHQVSIHSVDGLVKELQHQQSQLDFEHGKSPPSTRSSVPTIVVLNLCDGTESDGYPGVTIARALEATLTSTDPSHPPLHFTGADSAFFHTTTDKVTMKKYFADAQPPVRTSRFVDMSDISMESIDPNHLSANHAALVASLSSLTFPLIIKPTNSYSSCGLTDSSVVQSPIAALQQSQVIKKELGSVLAEEYIQGREFSMLIVGDSTRDDVAAQSLSSPSPLASSSLPLLVGLRCYSPAERAFSSSLSPLHQFLTFEQNYPTKFTTPRTWWQKHDSPNRESEQAAMVHLACQAYTACRGRSYGRIDIRQSSSTGEFYILEVNSLPGISGELDSSVGAILHHADTKFGQFLYSILHLAVERRLD